MAENKTLKNTIWNVENRTNGNFIMQIQLLKNDEIKETNVHLTPGINRVSALYILNTEKLSKSNIFVKKANNQEELRTKKRFGPTAINKEENNNSKDISTKSESDDENKKDKTKKK